MAHSNYDHDYDQTTKRPALSTHQHRIPLLEAKMTHPLACLMLLPLLLLLMLLLLRLLTRRQIHQLLLVSAVQPTSRITRAASLALAYLAPEGRLVSSINPGTRLVTTKLP